MLNDLYIKFSFDYYCSPIWLLGKNCGDWLINSNGYFYSDTTSKNGEDVQKKVYDERLKGEIELEKMVNKIYDIHNHLFNINEFPGGNPYLGFKDEMEENDFYNACDYVIKRMREIYGDIFSVNAEDEKSIKERTHPKC